VTEPTAEDAQGSDARCPWCSSAVAADASTCPSCGAALHGASDLADEIPGVTKVDPITMARRAIARPNRLASWLAGDVDPLPPADPLAPILGPRGGAVGLEAAGPTSVAPPSEAVRREMRRIELEAIKAELEARAATTPDAAFDDRAAPAPEDRSGG
jgi:hypothetical protein